VDNTVYFNVIEKTNLHELDLLCLFIGDDSWAVIADFYSALELSLKECKTLPDGIMIFYSCDKKQKLENYWGNIDQKESFFNRLSKNNVAYTKSFYFAEMQSTGLILNEELCIKNALYSPQIDDLKRIYKLGLIELIYHNEVVHQAPAGHTFKHPSGKISKLFIQARELYGSETELQFVGRGLCSLNSNIKWCDLETVFIDSMGIYSAVKEALSFSNCAANIESFHSYTSIEKVNLPSCQYLVVISASTSGSMAKQLIEQGFSKDNIITLIDVEPRPDTCSVLIDLESSNILSEIVKVDGNETDIELVGEHFSYKAKPPRQITLGVPHTPKALLDVLKVFALGGVNETNERVEAIGKNPMLSLKPESLLNNNAFVRWLESELNWSVPSSVKTIVYSEDGASKELSEKIRIIIDNIHNSEDKAVIIEAKDLNEQSIKECKGVIIVSAFAGDGGNLRQISRDLREFETNIIPRHFLVGVGIPQSLESWKRLEQFLIRNATKRLYGFSAWKVLPLGPDSISYSWSELAILASESQHTIKSSHPSISDDEAIKCFEELEKVISASQNSLLPNTRGEALKITEGLVYFGDVFKDKIDQVTQSDTLLTISAAMQAAREHKDPAKCLRPTNYQSVIISPENFLRFNDDILQACILRTSLPSELDYSSNHHVSELMAEFLSKVFSRHEHSFGSAALEFAAALTIGKMKLKKEHCIELVNKSLDNSQSLSNALIGFLLILKNKQA
jgi:hypothetical protein